MNIYKWDKIVAILNEGHSLREASRITGIPFSSLKSAFNIRIRKGIIKKANPMYVLEERR